MKDFRVDLRSDTVTKPSVAMRRAMAEAEVGDDWFGDDPTVHRLQERAAEITGKEAALYVPTGTMANQIALRLHFSGPGHLVAAEPMSHVASTEVMSAAVLSGIAYRTVHGDRRGRITADQVRAALEPDEPYDVEIVDLVCLENTSGHAGGTVMDVDDFRAIRKVAEEAGVAVHLDGARIFNASAASGVDVAEYAAEVDTLMFCVSKGLGAPIGSLVCGTTEQVREGRRIKILFGGAWRQAGVIAAAGLIALEEGPKRLHEDHERARRLGEAVAELVPGSLDPADVETNMVFADTEASMAMTPLEVANRLEGHGVGVSVVSGKVRMVTHVDIADEDIETAIAAWRPWRGTIGGSSVKLFGPRYPEEIAKRIPPGQRLVKTVAGAAFRPGPGFRRVDVEPRGERPRGQPLFADVRRAEGARPGGRGGGHALRHRLVDARQHMDRRSLPRAGREGRRPGRREMGDRPLRLRVHLGPVIGIDAGRRRARGVGPRRRAADRRARIPAPPRRAQALRVEEREVAPRARVLGAEQARFWEVRGYHIHAEPWAEERYSYQEGPAAELEP
jgi:threonine aldolase